MANRVFCQLNQEVKELSDLKSRFVSMVSHELRTPLTVIQTSTKILEQYSHIASQEKKQRYFQQIYDAIGNMTRLLEDVLASNMTSAIAPDFQPVEIDFEQFCEAFATGIDQSVGSRLAIECLTQGSRRLSIDPNLLQIILMQLVSNALKYSPSSRPVEVKLWVEDGVMVEVCDRGIGIPLADQPHVFKPFYRASNAVMIQGMGLGLAIAHQCALQHHGEITLSSHEEKGTIARVRLPNLNLTTHHCPPHSTIDLR